MPLPQNAYGGVSEVLLMIICKQKVIPPKLRYVLGRTNAGGKWQGNHTLSFHVNPYFGCVTANKFTNRETWIVEITPPIIVATIKDRNPNYSTKICQTIRSNSHGAMPHFIWIESKGISSGSPTTQGATPLTTTLSRCGLALSQDALETD